MRILILNWRDIKNPAAGGAEILTHEMAKLWVMHGHSVTQISASFKSSSSQDIVDGVKIIRMGRWYTVHVQAFFYYVLNLKNKTDVIIDEVHGLPFFSKLYAPSKTILFACEVADKLFFKVFPYPLALFGRTLENIYFSHYRNLPVFAISPSTKEDLVRHGFSSRNITVLPMGLTVPKKIKKFPKEKNPTLIYLSRINKQKGIEDAVQAFSLIHKNFKKSKLWIAGSGDAEYVNTIKKSIRQMSISSSVKFFGFVNEAKKFELLSRAHILIFPSIHEGWGLVIAEAGIVGTPAAVYNVPGVRDVVKKGERGIIVEKDKPEFLAEAVIKILENDKLYKKLVSKLSGFKREIGWDNTSNTSLKILKKYENTKA